jgi:hypothetical protein
MTCHNEYLIFGYNFRMLHHTLLNIISSIFADGPLVDSERKMQAFYLITTVMNFVNITSSCNYREFTVM